MCRTMPLNLDQLTSYQLSILNRVAVGGGRNGRQHISDIIQPLLEVIESRDAFLEKLKPSLPLALQLEIVKLLDTP